MCDAGTSLCAGSSTNFLRDGVGRAHIDRLSPKERALKEYCALISRCWL